MADVYELKNYKEDPTSPTVKEKVEALVEYFSVDFVKVGDAWIAVKRRGV